MHRCRILSRDAQVRGQSLMASDIAVRMIPDPHHVRLALEVNGEVAALTRSTAGPATFYSDSESTLRRPQAAGDQPPRHSNGTDRSGRGQQFATAGASDTDFDGVPIFGRVARNLAVGQHDQKDAGRRRGSSRKNRRQGQGAGRSRDVATDLGRRQTIAGRGARADGFVAVGSDDDCRRDDREAFQHADSSGRSRSARRPHAASPGPGRQPGERSDPREHAQQRAGAARVGRPDLRFGRPWQAACRAAPSLPAEAGRSGPGGREDHLRRQGCGPRPLQRRPPGNHAGDRPAEQGSAEVEGFSGPRLLSAGRAGPSASIWPARASCS